MPTFLHLTWFADPERFADTTARTFFRLPPPDIAILIGIVFAVMVGIVAIAALGKRIAAVNRLAHKLEYGARFAPYVVSTLTGIALVGHSLRQALFAPDLPLAAIEPFINVFSAVQLAIGIGLALGFFVHVFAIGLIALYGAALILFPWTAVIHYIGFLGIGLYLAMVGRETSLNACLGRPRKNAVAHESKISILRIVTGAELVILGFSEKLFDGRLGLTFLAEHPAINVLAKLHPWMTDERFVYVAGLVEVGLGLLLLLKWAPRLTAAVLAALLLTTLALFGPLELFGHLPFFGVGFALLTYGHCTEPPPRQQEKKRRR